LRHVGAVKREEKQKKCQIGDETQLVFQKIIEKTNFLGTASENLLLERHRNKTKTCVTEANNEKECELVGNRACI
jgi:hypothetical protein